MHVNEIARTTGDASSLQCTYGSEGIKLCSGAACGGASYWRSFQTVGHVKRVKVHLIGEASKQWGM